MARHTSDTTQTENNNNNSGNIATSNPSLPLKIPNGGLETKQINRTATLPPIEATSIPVHEVHEDSRSENHSPQPSNVNIALNGNYHRSDEVDFVQTKILPKPEQPVFEKVLLPEKRRPEKQNVPNPRENTSQTEFVTERIIDQTQNAYDQRQTAYDARQTSYDQRPTTYDQRQSSYEPRQSAYDQNNFGHQDFSHHPNINIRYQPHQNYGYVRDNLQRTRKQQFTYDNRPLMVVRDYSNSRANMSYDQRIKSASYRRSNNFNNSATRKSHCKNRDCSSDDDENISAIQPGFVANAAKVWDSRAKRDFNTVV